MGTEERNLDRPVDPNLATFWLPRLKGFHVPPTEIVPLDRRIALDWFDGKGDVRPFLQKVREAAKRIGYPVFIRTDFSSAKHSGPSKYKAEGDDEIGTVVMSTIEDSELKAFPGGDYTAILVRKFVELNSTFQAFGGHPIAREWRFFTKGEQVICSHFYWPEYAITSASFHKPPLPKDWKKRLTELGRISREERLGLAQVAVRVAKQFPEIPGGWSVDFAKGPDGWWLIDMALASRSWHPACKNAPKGR